jgi:hypothetical protein
MSEFEPRGFKPFGVEPISLEDYENKQNVSVILRHAMCPSLKELEIASTYLFEFFH